MSRLTQLLAIRPGEGRMTGLIVGVMLLTAAGAALGGTGIEALFFARFGVDYLPYMFFGLGLMNMLASFAITAALSRIARTLLYIALPLLIASILLLARLALLTGWSGLYPALWLGKEILNLLIGLSVWGLANLVCDTRQAKRLFPLFNASRILGAVIGGFGTGALVGSIGTENLLLVWAGTMALTFGLSSLLVRRGQSAAAHARPPRRARLNLSEGIRRGFEHVRRSALLSWISAAAVLFSVLYFSIALPFSRAITGRYPNENDLAAFLGVFNGLSTAAAFLVSLFFANRLFARYGIMACLLFFPVIYLAGFAGLALLPVFAVVVLFRFAQMLWLSGIADPAYQAMFNVIPSERRDQARTFIDGIPGQAGIMIAGLILIIGEQTLEPRQLYLVGLGAAALCTYVLWQARRGYNAELIEALKAGRQTFFFNEERPFGGSQQDAATISAALDGLRHPDPTIRLISTEVLARQTGPQVTDRLIERIRDEDALVRAAAVRALAHVQSEAASAVIAAAARDPDPDVRLEAISALSGLTGAIPGAPTLLARMLADPNSRVSTRAALIILKHQEITRGKKGRLLHARARRFLRKLAGSNDAGTRLNAIAAIGDCGEPDSYKFLAAQLTRRARLPAIRIALNTAIARLDAKRALPHLVHTLRDSDPAVRANSASLIGSIGAPAMEPVLAALNRPSQQDGALLALEALPPPPPEPVLKLIHSEVARAVEYGGLMRGVRGARAGGRDSELSRPDALLVEALRFKSYEYGVRAVRAFGLLTDHAGIALAVAQLQSRNPAQRAAALEMIDSVDAKWKSILQPLINVWEDNAARSTPLDWARLLDDQDDWVRACAAYAARRLDQRALHRRLNSLAKNDPDAFVRDAARKGKTMKSISMLSMMDRILFLKRVPMFAHLSPGDLKQVAVIANEASFKDGEVLAEEGEQGDVLYIIVEGEVIVTKSDAGGQVLELARRRSGEYVGEMAIINREPRMATLAASGDTYALTIDQKSFEGLLRERPDVCISLISELSLRLIRNTELFEQLKSQARQP